MSQHGCVTISFSALRTPKSGFVSLKGDIFSSDANRSDIVFTSIDHTGLILRLESRQRIWRWLDQRQNFGFTTIDGSAVGALITLATLSKGDNMTVLAKMILWMALYEVRMASWNVSSDEAQYPSHFD